MSTTPPSKVTRSNVVLIPAAAVESSGDTGTVFILHDDTVERRAVRLGSVQGESVTVLSGLEPGMRIASGDLSKLNDGMRVRVEQ